MNLIKFQLLLSNCLLVAIVTPGSNGQDQTHECERPCETNGQPKTCQYYFEVEKYYVMSKACYHCPYKPEDCNREDCIAADGVERLITVINRRLSAEGIQVCAKDTVEVIVHNMMSEEAVSIHWHGVHHIEKTQFMDGVALLTQCPIHPMMSFKYTFTPNPGTLLFHSHVGLQRADGTFGALIIRKPKVEEVHKDLYDEDSNDHVIVLNDWTHEPILDKFVSYYQALGVLKPDTLLINGRGRYKSFKNDKNEEFFTPVSVFRVKKDIRYRMRVINAGSLYCPIEMMVDKHRMKIIATDGVDIEAVEGDSLVLCAGERWDIIIEANQEIDNYWMKFKGSADCEVNKAFNLAVLRYEGSKDELPNSDVTYDNIVTQGTVINQVNVPSGEETSVTLSELKSANGDPTTDPALGNLELDPLIFAFDFYAIDNPTYHKHGVYGFDQVPEEYRRRSPQFNHISMKMPSFPPLTQSEDIQPDTFCDEHQDVDCTKKFCGCTYLRKVPLNKVFQIIFIDEGNPFKSNHPMHIHGYTCRIVAMEKIGDNTSVDAVKKLIDEKKVQFNFVNPVFKDTWTVPRGGYTIVQCYSNNPGYWLLHCHIDFHMEIGMSVILKIGEDADMTPPPPNFPRCGNFPKQ